MTQLSLLLADDLTPVLDLPATAEAGLGSGPLEFHLWNHQGEPEGQTAFNLLAAVRTESATRPEVWLATGLPPQDEMWWRLRVIGFDNRGDASWSVPRSDWQPLGAYSALAIDRIPPDCAVYLEGRIQPPSSAETSVYRHKLVFFHNEYSQPIPHALGLLRRGILTGVGDLARSGIVSGCQVSVSPAADDRIRTAAGIWLDRGTLHGKVGAEHVLGQVDGSGAALSAGESYWASLTLGAGAVSVTQGEKAINPRRPTLPVGEPFVRSVRVEHQAGGVSVIEDSDLDGETLYDRFYFEPGAGLSGTLHAGQALGAGTWRYRAHSTLLAFAAGVTSFVWLLGTGKPSVTTEPDAPEVSALLLWEVTTDASAIVSVVDRRTYAADSRVITLGGELPASPGLVDRLTVVEDRLFIERVVVDVPDLGGGTSGETVFDLVVGGTSIYPSSGLDDQRPQFAWDVSELTHQGGVPERLELRRGVEIRLETVQHAEGGVPPRVRVSLLS